MPFTLLSTQVPSPIVYSGVHAVADDGALTSLSLIQGDTTQLRPKFNENATRLDLLGRYGGGGYAVCEGLDLSAGSDLDLEIAAGHAMIDGVVEVPDPGVTVTLTDDIARVWIWLSQSGSIVQVNNSLTPPAGAHALLGSAVTASGAITSVDQSGVLYRAPGGPLWRRTSDQEMPADTPSSKLIFLHIGDGATWVWNGPQGAYRLLTEDAPALAAITHDDAANYTVDHPARLAKILIVGGTLTAGRNLVLPATAGRQWLVQNATAGGFAVTVKTSGGSGVAVPAGDFALLFADGTDILGGLLS